MSRPKSKVNFDEKVPELPMTPMIDVVFQLLIFFMLTMKFKEEEGKLITQLPKDKGLASSSVPQPEMAEIRVVICAGGDVRLHKNNKGEHERVIKPGEVCKFFVDQIEIGDLYQTSKHDDKMTSNQQLYRTAGDKIKELSDATPSTRDSDKKAPIILDVDSEVPYEHVIGIINACKERDLESIEFAGNPRFGSYYGSGSKEQFKMK